MIELRDYQKDAVNCSLTTLNKRNDTLLIAPTGSGKTLILSSLISGFISKNTNSKVLVIQHRKEILEQNVNKFKLINKDIPISIVNAESRDTTGSVIFGMVQTIHRNFLDTLATDKLKIDLVVWDEAHHVAADSYVSIWEQLNINNPDIKAFGVTATPERGDKKDLKCIFNHICKVIDIHYLIGKSYLVPPRQFVIDIGTQNTLLEAACSSNSEMQLEQAEAEILAGVNVDYKTAYERWAEIAKDRLTVAFTPTNQTSYLIAEQFSIMGAVCDVVTCNNSPKDRNEKLEKLKNKKINILFNTAILTEGWDCPEISCVLLFKSCSFKSTYIQMVGRGLRTFTGKNNCIIIDYGASSILHGSLEINSNKAITMYEPGVPPSKECKCGAIIPLSCMTCPFCGHEFKPREETEKQRIEDFKLKELQVFKKLNKKATSEVFEVVKDKIWVSTIGFGKFLFIKYDEYLDSYSAGLHEDNFVSDFGKYNTYNDALSELIKYMKSLDEQEISKQKGWIKKLPTDKQVEILRKNRYNYYKLNRYQASCIVNYLFNRRNILYG